MWSPSSHFSIFSFMNDSQMACWHRYALSDIPFLCHTNDPIQTGANLFLENPFCPPVVTAAFYMFTNICLILRLEFHPELTQAQPSVVSNHALPPTPGKAVMCTEIVHNLLPSYSPWLTKYYLKRFHSHTSKFPWCPGDLNALLAALVISSSLGFNFS